MTGLLYIVRATCAVLSCGFLKVITCLSLSSWRRLELGTQYIHVRLLGCSPEGNKPVATEKHR